MTEVDLSPSHIGREPTQPAPWRHKILKNFTAMVTAGALLSGCGDNGHANIDGHQPNESVSILTTQYHPCGTIKPVDQAKDRLLVRNGHLQDLYNKVIVPDGMSIAGGPEQKEYLKVETSADAQIDAGSQAWQANTIRLQASEDLLFRDPTPGYGYNRTFARYLNRLVCRVIKHHEIAVVNDNTLFTDNELDPTNKTVKFWRFMAERYRNYPTVIFDLFNEPRLTHPKGDIDTKFNPQQVWGLWQKGGDTGDGVNYVGMQTLVNDIRRDGSNNVIWIEPPYETSRTIRLPQHLIKDDNLEYSVHKENLDLSSSWHKQIGRLVHLGLPVEDGEWTVFAAEHRPWECYNSAYTTAPQYLAYMHSLGVGVLGWSLQKGSLVKGGEDGNIRDTNQNLAAKDLPVAVRELSTPNKIKPNFACDKKSSGQGAGTLLMEYFKKYSKALPGGLFPKFSHSS